MALKNVFDNLSLNVHCDDAWFYKYDMRLLDVEEPHFDILHGIVVMEDYERAQGYKFLSNDPSMSFHCSANPETTVEDRDEYYGLYGVSLWLPERDDVKAKKLIVDILQRAKAEAFSVVEEFDRAIEHLYHEDKNEGE